MPRTESLLEAPVGRTIVRLALPNVAVMVVQTCIGLIETYFVAKLGVDALAAMALVFPPFMLLVMVSAGAMGGGILSAIARALGASDRARPTLWSGTRSPSRSCSSAATTAAALLWGPKLYALMGGRDGSLARGGDLFDHHLRRRHPALAVQLVRRDDPRHRQHVLPASVITAGAFFLIPISPLLIFGFGPLPRLGIAGGAVAVLIYYVVGCAIFAVLHLVRPRRAVAAVEAAAAAAGRRCREILRVGLASSVISLSTNVTAVVATGLAGLVGPAAVAGYGTGVRLEYLLVPLVFGLGAPVAAMVGTAIGAGQPERALRVAWTGAAIAGGLTEAIGIAAALFPQAWLSLFGGDAGDARLRRALSAHGRTVLRLLRRRPRALFRLARRRHVSAGRCWPRPRAC